MVFISFIRSLKKYWAWISIDIAFPIVYFGDSFVKRSLTIVATLPVHESLRTYIMPWQSE